MASNHAPESFSWHYSELAEPVTFQGHYVLVRVLIIAFTLVVSALLFLLFYCTCPRRRRWSHNVHSAANNNRTTMAAVIASVGIPAASNQSLGLDAAAIGELPMSSYSSETTAEREECSICLGLFEEYEKVRVLPDCHHTYHLECADKWLSTHSTCPLCRTSLQALQRVSIDIPS